MDASKGKQSEHTHTLQLTEPAYFSALYDYLLKESKITVIKFDDIKSIEGLVEGQFIELTGIAQPPTVEHWIARVKMLLEFIDNNFKLLTQSQSGKRAKTSPVLSRQQIDLFKRMVNFLDDFVHLSRSDPGRQYMCITEDNSDYNVWCGLIPEFVISSLHAVLPTRVNLVGRIERLLQVDETYKIVDLSQFNQPDSIGRLLDVLNTLSPLIGQKQISESDLQAQYPDIFVAPIAIYR